MVSIERPLSLLRVRNVCLSRTHFSNHTKRFLRVCSEDFLVKNIPQFLHLKRCFPACFPHRITSRLPQAQHLIFLISHIQKKFTETVFSKPFVNNCYSYTLMVFYQLFFSNRRFKNCLSRLFYKYCYRFI